MPKPAYHILVCTNKRPAGHPRGSCGENGAEAVLEKLSLFKKVRPPVLPVVSLSKGGSSGEMQFLVLVLVLA